jgi:hypothetical protein
MLKIFFRISCCYWNLLLRNLWENKNYIDISLKILKINKFEIRYIINNIILHEMLFFNFEIFFERYILKTDQSFLFDIDECKLNKLRCNKSKKMILHIFQENEYDICILILIQQLLTPKKIIFRSPKS